ncbi:MAG: type II/IV secretion system protein [Patescibacteria group bacterium]|nr:type II/IV secretion system protein [Patescibacteria group bacterium]MDE2438483.1 type II/IV secretion system protein [Patescibacteria group bacterium]
MFGEESPQDIIKRELKKTDRDISIILIVNSLIEYAYESRASDIHIDPGEDGIAIRLRIDGIMYNAFTFPKGIQPEIISRIKVLAELRTDEHQAAQDGRIKFKTHDKKSFDIRVSIVPTYYNENAVLRLLVEQGDKFSLKNVGFSERDLSVVQHAISKPYGMILATGPTGSGKTTTLYTLLKELNKPPVSIITIEDPIEFSLENVDQIQVNNQTGLTFANGLRAILRQDPNIIMVGEIRDEETAGIAVNAALTGHLLLSTIHTNDAATTLPRLLDMGIEPFLIASTVNVAIGQRLLRVICPDCRKPHFPTKEEQELLTINLPQGIAIPQKIYKGEGCSACGKSGYRGRIPIYEVLDVSDAIRNAIINHESAADIKKIAIREGMTTMYQDGFKKVAEGITTIEEVLRIAHE